MSTYFGDESMGMQIMSGFSMAGSSFYNDMQQGGQNRKQSRGKWD